MQKYTNAWYGADHETMNGLISDDFVGVYRNQSGAVVDRITSAQLIANTKNGDGRRQNEIYYNRIIRDIDIADEQASVTLISRETIHHMSMAKKNDEWLISRDDFSDRNGDPA